MSFVYLSKIDVAKRQLETAIKLFFKGEDFVSIHALVRNSHEILEALCIAQNIQSELSQILDNIRPEMLDEFRKTIDKPKNFFKHGKSDQKDTLEFNPDSSGYFLWDAGRLYSKLTGEKPREIFIFDMWFSLQDPRLFLEEKVKGILNQMRKNFNMDNKTKFYEEALSAYEFMKSSQNQG